MLLYPVEALNDVAANALLKMLEEPPPATVFVLIADQVAAVPPTIASRCRKVPLAMPDPDVAAAWLRAQGTPDAETALALAGGAPLGAAAIAKDGDAMDMHRALVRFLAAPSADAALATAESFARAAPAPLVRALQTWVADCIEARLAGRVRYHPAQRDAIARLAGAVDVDALWRLSARVMAVRRAVDHPLNVRLLLEGLLLAYADAMTPAVAPTPA